MTAVAIVGRPNVGKSTLFNRLVGRRAALVDPTPGVTRDRRTGSATIAGRPVTVIDTAGLEESAPESLEARMRDQTRSAVADADAVLFVIDARAGLTAHDEHFARWLRRLGRKVVLVANKCEGRAAEAGLGEAFRLGFGAPIAVSAEHGVGLGDLDEAIGAALGEAVAEAPVPEAERPIRLAVIGRPNVGKSTLVNALLGAERMLTGPEPGITRDAIEIPWTWKERRFVLVDTAGLRRKARIEDRVERMATGDTVGAVRLAQVCVLVLDATQPVERQDLHIGRLVAEEGRALAIAANKWDLIEDGPRVLRALNDRIAASLPQCRGVAVVTVSAASRLRLDRLMQAVVEAHEVWRRELPTSQLNRWLEGVAEAHPPPAVKGRRPRLRFMRQVATRPPTFAIFGSRLVSLPEDYQRYLANALRESFDLPGTPIRFQLRQTHNPFVDGERE